MNIYALGNEDKEWIVFEMITKSLMKGDNAEPILATIEHVPIPAFLATVGKISAEKRYIMENAPLTNTFPDIAKVIWITSYPSKRKKERSFKAYKKWTILEKRDLHSITIVFTLLFI